MQNNIDSNDIMHYLFTEFCTSNQERYELDKWIKKDGIDHVLSSMKDIFHRNFRKNLVKSNLTSLNSIQGRIVFTVEYAFNTSNPSIAYFHSIDELLNEISKQEDFYKFCDSSRLITVEKKIDNIKF